MAKIIIYQKELSKIIMSLSMEKNFFYHPVDCDIKRYKEIGKLTTGQGGDYTTGFLLDYDYIKNHYKLMTVDLIRKKELDADPKANQQIQSVRQLQNDDGINADGTQSMFAFTNLEKIKEMRPKFSQGSVTVLWKMANYEEARVKLTNTQLNKLKSAAKNKNEATLIINCF